MEDYRAGKKTAWTTRGHAYHDALACAYVDAHDRVVMCVTRRAGVIRARGLGWVRLGVRMDVASVSGSLRRLVFLVQDFSHGQRARREGQWREGQRGGKLRVRSGQCFTAMIFNN